jgi:crossover junction endonuclease MUS81
MDDLSSSICDGRFEEQKHRFMHAEIQHGVYLVEDYGRIENQRLPAETLRQAMANSEVCDGFFIKHTADTAATVAYLVLMHRQVCARHEQAPLIAKGISAVALQRQHPTGYLCATFTDFTSLTLKSQVLRVEEMFVKQLMQMAGLTAEKAAAIAQIYPTPKALMAAYDTQATPKECNSMLENIDFKKGGPRSKLGPAISAKVARLYCEEILP